MIITLLICFARHFTVQSFSIYFVFLVPLCPMREIRVPLPGKKFGWPYLGNVTAAARAALPTVPVCEVYVCVQTVVQLAASVKRFLTRALMLTNAVAHGGRSNTVRAWSLH